jgi:hypothetical protein
MAPAEGSGKDARVDNVVRRTERERLMKPTTKRFGQTKRPILPAEVRADGEPDARLTASWRTEAGR